MEYIEQLVSRAREVEPLTFMDFCVEPDDAAHEQLLKVAQRWDERIKEIGLHKSLGIVPAHEDSQYIELRNLSPIVELIPVETYNSVLTSGTRDVIECLFFGIDAEGSPFIYNMQTRRFEHPNCKEARAVLFDASKPHGITSNIGWYALTLWRGK